MVECARIVPETSSPVFVVDARGRTTTEDADEGDDHKDADGSELDAGGPELLLPVSENAEDVDDDDEEQENGDPYADVDLETPVFDGETGDDEFERQDDRPLEDVVPTHGEAPGRIDEASRVRVETTGDGIHDGELTESVDYGSRSGSRSRPRIGQGKGKRGKGERKTHRR